MALQFSHGSWRFSPRGQCDHRRLLAKAAELRVQDELCRDIPSRVILPRSGVCAGVPPVTLRKSLILPPSYRGSRPTLSECPPPRHQHSSAFGQVQLSHRQKSKAFRNKPLWKFSSGQTTYSEISLPCQQMPPEIYLMPGM